MHVKMEALTRLQGASDSDKVPNHPKQISKATSVKGPHEAWTPSARGKILKGVRLGRIGRGISWRELLLCWESPVALPPGRGARGGQASMAFPSSVVR